MRRAKDANGPVIPGWTNIGNGDEYESDKGLMESYRQFAARIVGEEVAAKWEMKVVTFRYGQTTLKGVYRKD